jgi:hypothetical protein
MEGLTDMILKFSCYLKDFIFCGKKRYRNHIGTEEHNFHNHFLTNEIMENEKDQIFKRKSYNLFLKLNSIRENKSEGDKLFYPFVKLSDIEKLNR